MILLSIVWGRAASINIYLSKILSLKSLHKGVERLQDIFGLTSNVGGSRLKARLCVPMVAMI